MSKAVILGAKIRMKREELESAQSALNDIKKRSEELLASIDSIENAEDLAVVETELETVQGELDAKQSEVISLTDDITSMEQEIEELNTKKPETKTEEKEQRNMTKNNKEYRDNLNRYVRTKGETREGVKTTEVGALIPKDLMPPQEAKTLSVNLETLVNKVKVTTGAGEYPVIHKSNQKMNSVEELEKNPELSRPTFTKVAYNIETYRGYIPISQEALDDASYDLAGLVTREIADQELNTKNAEIAKVLKSATAKTAQGFDGLKDIINKEISPIYDIVMIVSQSMFAALDKVKDKNGRYLLQQDITSPTGYKFAGKTIYVLPDTMIGDSENDMKGFIGDPKAFATLFDRVQASVRWTDNNIYGQLLAGYVRFDVQKTDAKAGVYVTYTDAV